jgi:hypothetical protein
MCYGNAEVIDERSQFSRGVSQNDPAPDIDDGLPCLRDVPYDFTRGRDIELWPA